MKLLHQFTHGNIRPLKMLSEGFNKDGVKLQLDQNLRDARFASAALVASCLEIPMETFMERQKAIKSDAEAVVVLKGLYDAWVPIAEASMTAGSKGGV